MTDEGFVWFHSPDEVFPEGLDRYVSDIRMAIMQISRQRAPEIETWMKNNAPWEDRTGNARQTLHTEVWMMAEQAVIRLSHGMGYGTFLELAHGGRWAVIGPALDHFAPKIWNDVEQLFR